MAGRAAALHRALMGEDELAHPDWGFFFFFLDMYYIFVA